MAKLAIPAGGTARYHGGMAETTITAPDDLLDKLRALAAERRVPVTDIILEALEAKAATYRESGPRRLPRSLGMGASGRTDISRRTGKERPVPRS